MVLSQMILLMEDLNYPSWPLSQIQWNMGTPTTQLQTQAIPLDGSVRGLLFGNRFVWWTFTRETEHALRDRWCLPWAKWKLLESPCLFKVQGPDVQTKTILKKKKAFLSPEKHLVRVQSMGTVVSAVFATLAQTQMSVLERTRMWLRQGDLCAHLGT